MMAVESLLKLGAMAILGVFVWSRFDLSLPIRRCLGCGGFSSLILLGVLAMFTCRISSTSEWSRP